MSPINQLINYMNDCAEVIEGQQMTARCFNDFVCYNGRKSCNLYKTVQVCYWSNQWNGSEYNTPDAIQNADYKMINTNQKWYFVPSKADEYGKNVVLNNFQTFDVTKYQNIKSGYNPTSTTYTEIPVGTTNMGAMFCVWCDTPSVDVSLTDVQELIAAMAAANPTYFKQSTVVDPDPETPVIKLGDDTVGTEGLALTTGVNTTLSLSGDATAEWTSSNEEVLQLQAVSAATRAAVTGANAVEVIPVAAGTAAITAKLEDGTELTVQATVQEPGTVRITVAKGSTVTDTQDKDCTGSYTADPAGIVAISTEVKTVTGDPTYDLITALTSGECKYYASSEKNVAAPSVELTFESVGNGQYYIKNANDRYVYPDATYSYSYSYGGYRWTYSSKESSSKQAVDVKFNGDGSVTISKSVTDRWGGSTTAYLTISDSDLSGSGSSSSKIYLYKKNDHAGYQTTISFEGLNPGDATVTIGDVTYIINVTEKDYSKVTLPVNLWITNTGVVPTGWSNGNPSAFGYADTDGNRRSIYTLTASDSTVRSEKGIVLSSVLPMNSATGLMEGTAKSWDSNTYDVVYWKSAYHTAENRQSTDGWTNNSHLGTTFTYIRYWDESWAYSVDGIQWTNIDNVGAGAEDTTKNQVNIWFRQKTEITDEVRTDIVDWGPINYDANQCLLDFAVKYESGERTPGSFPVSGKTMGFDCPTDQNVPLSNGYVVKDGNYYYRTVYGIAGVETADYEVYMITVTPSSNDHGTYITNDTKPSSYTYGGTEKIAWTKTEADAAASDLGKTGDYTCGGEPFLEKVSIYQYQGLLVTYYVRARATEDALTVHYIDNSSGSEVEFYNYNIAVKSGTFFDSGIGLPETTAQYTENGKAVSSLTNGRVENANKKYQYVSSVLSNLTAIGAQYRYSDYECVRVTYNRAGDPKNVYLYYKFNNQHTYVVDFGLPLQIQLTDLNKDLASAKITKVEVKGAKHGSAVYSNSVLTYTLTEMLSEYERITVTVTGTKTVDGEDKTGEISYQVIIIPASTVYYEDSFVTFNNGAGAAAGAVWQPDGTTTSANQLLEELGQKTNPYGYDGEYKNCTTFSMGSAQKVTVSKAMNDNWKNSSDSAWPTATFTFRGTGFDVISLTDNDSGVVICKVTDSNGAPVYNKFINNYYGYTYTDGKFAEAKSGIDNKLYQLPIIKFTSDKWDTYTVTLTPAYGDMFDKTGDQQYSFWLDAIRVYDPLGKDNATYTTGNEKEGYPQYFEFHDALVGGKLQNTVTLIEGTTDAKVREYTNFGPNHEVYLAENQSVAFQLSGDMSKIASVQLGLKAVNGAAVYQIIGSEPAKTVNTATDMYYDITSTAVKNGAAQTVTITNTGSNILSLTNIKVTFKQATTVTLAEMTQAMQDEAVMAVRALFTTPVEPEPTPDPEPETFEPGRFEASWGRSVRAGQKATLTVKTSEDVESITVNGETVSAYSTRTERSGWGWWAKKVTYREFTYTVTAAATADYTVIAQNGDGAVSQPITATLTVRGGNSWWGSIFDRWF